MLRFEIYEDKSGYIIRFYDRTYQADDEYSVFYQICKLIYGDVRPYDMLNLSDCNKCAVVEYVGNGFKIYTKNGSLRMYLKMLNEYSFDSSLVNRKTLSCPSV